MKRVGLLAVLGLVAFAVIMSSCGPKKEIPAEQPAPPPPVVKDTTPVVTPPPPPPKATLSESQFKTCYFDFDKFNLRSDAKDALNFDNDLLNQFPDAIVKIEGHCDERGTVEYNLSLGEKRAKATMDYLTGLGIAPNRLSIISYGKERPVDQGHNESAWARNRRCEFRIISQ